MNIAISSFCMSPIPFDCKATSRRASSNGDRGNRSATNLIPSGKVSLGKNTPERNIIGRVSTFEMLDAALSESLSAAAMKPRFKNTKLPPIPKK